MVRLAPARRRFVVLIARYKRVWGAPRPDPGRSIQILLDSVAKISKKILVKITHHRILAPTHVHRSKTAANRLLFVPHSVVTGKDRPMKVVVEHIGAQGKVITATWSAGSQSEPLVWESSGTLYTNYDKDHDVFYISKGSTAPEYAEDDPKFGYLWLRKNDENDAPQGVTVFGLRDVPPQDKESLFSEIAFFLGVSKGDIELRANAIG